MYLKPIGVLQSCFKQKFGTPRQPGVVSGAVAEIVIDPQWQPEISLQGLEQFSHLWVIFEFHQNGKYDFHGKIHPPRLKGESMGVFATRSPHRPNPLGLSVVKIQKIYANRLLVTGIDMIDATPIYDIKPYLPHIESIPTAKFQWVAENPEEKTKINWTPAAEENLESLHTESEEIKKYTLTKEEVKHLITEVITQDPRPTIYKGYEGEPSPYRTTHYVQLFDLDIEFKFQKEKQAEITNIKLYKSPIKSSENKDHSNRKNNSTTP